MKAVVAIVTGYFIGSIPFALIVARRRGVDLRHVGSGNIGAANVLRTSGTTAGVLAMCLDAAKGATAVVLAQQIAGGAFTPAAAGLASIIGHVFPVWLRFHGGKGVATAGGAFLVLVPVAAIAAGCVFVVTTWVTRFVSVGSISASIALVVAALASNAPTMMSSAAALAALIIGYRHRDNLARLVAGTERRIGQRT